MRIVTSEEMRRLDEYAIGKAGLPGVVLMESAGRSVFSEIARRHRPLKGRRALVVCGPGNNGGDGLVVARYLKLAEAVVDCIFLGKSFPKTGDASVHLNAARAVGVEPVLTQTLSDLSRYRKKAVEWNLAVDAVFGTGLKQPLRGLYVGAVRLLNSLRVPVYSVDVPSGINATTGEVMGAAVKASCTVTFAFKKRGFFLNEGPEYTGTVRVGDISFDDAWADTLGTARVFESCPPLFEDWFSRRKLPSHKGTFGHVLVVAGSPGKSGAAVLASVAALRAGCGLVTLAIPAAGHTAARSHLVEVMSEALDDGGTGRLTAKGLDRVLSLLPSVNSVVVGPGLEPHEGLRELVMALVRRCKVPMVLDADGLTALGTDVAELRDHLGHAVLTPHPGEMSRLTGSGVEDIQRDRIETARSWSLRWKTNVILKGAHTVVSLRNGDVFVNPTGNPAMATAGMGDVLSGVLASYLAQGVPLNIAPVAAVYHHGLAGDRAAADIGPRGLLAGDLIERLPGLHGGRS